MFLSVLLLLHVPPSLLSRWPNDSADSPGSDFTPLRLQLARKSFECNTSLPFFFPLLSLPNLHLLSLSRPGCFFNRAYSAARPWPVFLCSQVCVPPTHRPSPASSRVVAIGGRVFYINLRPLATVTSCHPGCSAGTIVTLCAQR